jgi:hypothetical protein
MKRTGLPTAAWVLTGLLVIAAGLISLGQQDQTAFPAVKSFGPSGISAFAELLRKSGYRVSTNQESRPRLDRNDIAVAFEIVGHPGVDLIPDISGEKRVSAFDERFWEFVRDGGTGIVLPLSRDFLVASRNTKQTPPTAVKDLATGETFTVTTGDVPRTSSFDIPAEDAIQMELWKEGSGSFLRAFRVGKGTALVVRDAIGITNRFVDKNQNAQAFASLFSIVKKRNSRIVFTEASFGSINDPGLLETVGPWANAAWQQLIVLGLVVVFTLGKRFGTPDEVRAVQRGSRELLDAVADTFRRSRSTTAALETALRSADTDLRLVLKLPKDAPRAERDRLIPVTLQNALARLQVASEYPTVSQDHALDLIVRAQTELDAFIGPNRAKIRSLAKLRT